MKILFFIILSLFSFNAFAADSGMFAIFSSIENFFSSIYNFITVVIPQTIFDFFIYIKLWMAYHYALYLLDVIKHSHQFALSFIAELNLKDVIDTAIGNLPPDLRSAATEMRVFDSLTLLTEALITRFVYTIATR